MKCEKFLVEISSYIDNKLKGKELEEFENHLNNCTSCQEELNIVSQIVREINELEEIELPMGFHKQLMERIYLETELSLDKNKKWIFNWKVLSGIAAAFVFLVLIFEIVDFKVQKEAFPESTSIQLRTLNLEEEIQKDMPKVANDMGENDVPLKAFKMAGPIVTKWEIQTKDYEKCKNAILEISIDMGLETTTIQDQTLEDVNSKQFIIEMILGKDKIDNLASKVNEVCKEDVITFLRDEQNDETLEDSEVETLIITINEIK